MLQLKLFPIHDDGHGKEAGQRLTIKERVLSEKPLLDCEMARDSREISHPGGGFFLDGRQANSLGYIGDLQPSKDRGGGE
jgi:hypothetical protein